MHLVQLCLVHPRIQNLFLIRIDWFHDNANCSHLEVLLHIYFYFVSVLAKFDLIAFTTSLECAKGLFLLFVRPHHIS